MVVYIFIILYIFYLCTDILSLKKHFKCSSILLFQFLPYGSNAYKQGWYGIHFVVEVRLFDLNVLTEMTMIFFTFHLRFFVNKFMKVM